MKAERLVFVADLHLREEQGADEPFVRWLECHCQSDTALYILGDLFDTWLYLPSDDNLPLQPVIAAVNRAADRCAGVTIIVGNRDFLLARGSPFSPQVVVRTEPAVFVAGSSKVYAGHGDELCAHDRAYQIYKRIARSRAAYLLFRCLSLRLRQCIGNAMAKGSRIGTARRPISVLRPPLSAYAALAQDGYKVIVHGHLHRRNRLCVEEGSPGTVVYMLPSWDDTREWLEYRIADDTWNWRRDGPEQATP